jgi:Zn-dependent M28 family amino/carboxypeptidase
VPEGPGINDDGFGTATLLAQAEKLADGHYKLRNKIRFARWSAEEEGLIGSTYDAHNLSQAEVDKIDVMLDYDMLSSPNDVRFVYDGDGNAEPGNPAGPEGSGKAEQVFDDWFSAQGLQSERVPFDFGASKHPFGSKPKKAKAGESRREQVRHGHNHRVGR